jgi:hypothetical protein
MMETDDGEYLRKYDLCGSYWNFYISASKIYNARIYGNFKQLLSIYSVSSKLHIKSDNANSSTIS